MALSGSSKINGDVPLSVWPIHHKRHTASHRCDIERYHAHDTAPNLHGPEVFGMGRV